MNVAVFILPLHSNTLKKHTKKTNLAIHLHTNSAFTVQTQSTKKKMYVLFYFYKAFFCCSVFLEWRNEQTGHSLQNGH